VTGLTPGARLLLVEDDADLRASLAASLSSRDFSVREAGTAREAMAAWASSRPDLILLDLGLPDQDGLNVINRIRREATTPILVLSARHHEGDRVEALDLGADDYLTKPFEMMELLARVEARLRRHSPKEAVDAEAYRFGVIQVDFSKAEVTKDGAPVELSAREYQLLRYFIEHRGATISRDELLNHVWGYHAMPNTRTVDVHVAWLRQKIEPNPKHPQYVITAHGLGYKFAG
jgi:two-component system alkaline phosphatase synthesis response regulator PhoP